MEEVDQRRSRRLTALSFLISVEYTFNIYLAFLSYISSNQLYFNLVMIISLIDRVVSIVMVVIKNQYLQTWILDSLNISFFSRYTIYYFPEHQSMVTYAVYFKVLPSIIIQLIFFYLSNSAFYGISGDHAQILIIAF